MFLAGGSLKLRRALEEGHVSALCLGPEPQTGDCGWSKHLGAGIPPKCLPLYVIGTLMTPVSHVLVLPLRNCDPATFHSRKDLY